MAQAENDLRTLHTEHPERPDALARLRNLHDAREGSFEFVVETIGRTPPIIAQLRPLAKQDFGVYASMIRNPET